MIKITLKQLEEMNACPEGKKWFTEHKISKLKPLVSSLLKAGKANYARWLLPRLMTRPQSVTWAIYSAEQVLKIFEDKYPSDKRPRIAIKAAKDFLAGRVSAYAAAYAAYAAADAAYAADADAADAAAYAAYAAADAAYAADAGAADAAAYAANAAADAAARDRLNRKLMVYALKLLGE